MTGSDGYVVAGTGPRALQQLDRAGKQRAASMVEAAVADLQSQHGDQLVIMSGMALGFDKLLALTALRSDVRLWCAIPNRSYGPYYWGEAVPEFDAIVGRAWQVTYVMEDVHHTTGLHLAGVHANTVRNQWMVEQARELLAWPAKSPGTAHCIAAARAAGLPVRDVTQPAPEPLFPTRP